MTKLEEKLIELGYVKLTHYYEVIGNVYQHPELLEENYE